MFQPSGELDFVAIHRDVLAFWDEREIFEKLRAKLRGGPTFSFLDGPITANNPMGVHHAWGRTYKDLVQRYKAMCGFDQRFQNGFDCQGLWVEVEVEKALGFDSKRDIESFGLAEFSKACRERVLTFAERITDQSRQLGQWMDWPNSYYTMSDENTEYNWHFLAECHRRGWIYVGHRVMPWCTRCGTSISQHEMLDSYADVTHDSVVVALPIEGREREFLLAWTTTPWTLPANVALAVHPELDYEAVELDGATYYVAAGAREHFPRLGSAKRRLPGAELVGLRYRGPFDEVEAQSGVEHRVVAWKEVAADEGTGIVHIAPGCGEEDAELGKQEGLAVVSPVDGDGRYVAGFGALTGKLVKGLAPELIEDLRGKGLLFDTSPYAHRYPTCWRCGEELIFRLVDEWFIRADELRPVAIEANAAVTWHPPHLGLRMNDWLHNMGDWCISRKRYWGLPLPFYPCRSCGELTVVGSLAELRERALDPAAVDGLAELHRPWIDAVRIRCAHCDAETERVPEVGDCWLDAGIVPYSTLHALSEPDEFARWIPADLIIEMTAQIRGWFYAMLFMGTALEGRSPYKTVVTHDKVLAEDGREMHKSWGNAIWFDDAVEEMGPDVIRTLFCSQSITEPIRFGFEAARGVKRRFLTFWNVYNLFVTYANLDRPALEAAGPPPDAPEGLEAWILARLQSTTRTVREALDAYEVRRAMTAIEEFFDDLSNWYVRRRRRLFWKGEQVEEKQAAYQTLHHALVETCKLLAPFTPFLSETVFRNLSCGLSPQGAESIHLTDYPEPKPALADEALEAGVAFVRRVVRAGLAARNASGLKVRQPLAKVTLQIPPEMERWLRAFEADVRDELNVEAVETSETLAEQVEFSAKLEIARDALPEGVALKALRAAVAAQPADALRRALARDGRVTLEVEPVGPVELTGAEIRISARGVGDCAAAVDREIVAALDTKLTPELERKGRVREVTRHVQTLRRKADLDVADRIELRVEASGPCRQAIEERLDFVADETLATEVGFGAPPEGWHTADAKIGDEAIRLALRRAE